MHPHAMLQAMVAEHRRELIVDATVVRRATEGQARPIRLLASTRRSVGHRLVRLGQALAGAPFPIGGLPRPAGRQG